MEILAVDVNVSVSLLPVVDVLSSLNAKGVCEFGIAEGTSGELILNETN